MLNTKEYLQIDYAGDGKYVLLIGDPFISETSEYFDSVKSAFDWIMNNYGDTPVELSQTAHLILTIELGVDNDTDFAK